MPRKTDPPLRRRHPALDASMRPRPDAAENSSRPAFFRTERKASMRPRPDAAENARSGPRRRRRRRRFNEAAARCRGKRAPRRGPSPPRRRFNEAAARCRGKPFVDHLQIEKTQASMRPRPDAAENAERASTVPSEPSEASMRPRPDAAENPIRGQPHPPRHAASMRPRPDAAENSVRTPARHLLLRASMRPRPDAAENSVLVDPTDLRFPMLQ